MSKYGQGWEVDGIIREDQVVVEAPINYLMAYKKTMLSILAKVKTPHIYRIDLSGFSFGFIILCLYHLRRRRLMRRVVKY